MPVSRKRKLKSKKLKPDVFTQHITEKTVVKTRLGIPEKVTHSARNITHYKMPVDKQKNELKKQVKAFEANVMGT